MAWTAPTTFVTGTPATAAALNALVTDVGIVGNAWTDDTAARASTAIWTTSGASLGNGTLVSRYRLSGKTLDWLVVLTFGSTTTTGSAAFTFAWPGGVTPLTTGAVTAARYFDNSAPQRYTGDAEVGPSALVMYQITSAGAVNVVNSTSPFAWATNDVCAVLITGLEVA